MKGSKGRQRLYWNVPPRFDIFGSGLRNGRTGNHGGSLEAVVGVVKGLAEFQPLTLGLYKRLSRRCWRESISN